MTAKNTSNHWLLRVTVNRCRTLLACPWRTRRADAVPDAPDPAQALDAGQRALYEAVRALPPGQRVALYLYYFEGYSTAEIAQLLHLRQTAVTTPAAPRPRPAARAAGRNAGIKQKNGKELYDV